MVKSFLSNQSSGTFHLFFKPLTLAGSSPSPALSQYVMESRNFDLLPLLYSCFFSTESLISVYMPASLLFLCRGTGGMGRLTSAPDCSALLTPGCPKEEFCCWVFWGLELLTTGVLKEGIYQNVKWDLPAMFNSAKCCTSIF